MTSPWYMILALCLCLSHVADRVESLLELTRLRPMPQRQVNAVLAGWKGIRVSYLPLKNHFASIPLTLVSILYTLALHLYLAI